MMGNLEIAQMAASIGATSHKRNDCELFHSGEHLQGGISTPKMSLLATIPSTITSDYLSKIWSIDEDLAAGAINHNTHLYRRSAENDLSRQLSTNDRMLRYRRINIIFFSDTFFVTKKGKSVRGFTSAQIFESDKGYISIYLMRARSDFKEALHQFCKEVGVPTSIVADPAGEHKSNKVRTFCH